MNYLIHPLRKITDMHTHALIHTYLPSCVLLYAACGTYWTSRCDDVLLNHNSRVQGAGLSLCLLYPCSIFRCTTLGLLMILGMFYMKFMLIFQMLAVLDICSHWIQMYRYCSNKRHGYECRVCESWCTDNFRSNQS